MKRLVLILGFALIVATPKAEAAFINGAISFSDGGLALPAAPTTSIVSALTVLTQGTPVANGCTTDFTSVSGCDLAGAVTAGTINTGAPAGSVYTYGGFTFTLTNVALITPTPLSVNFLGLGNDALQFVIGGIVTKAGFDPTAFLGVFTANGGCQGTAGPPATCTSNITASWSSSVVALGVGNTVPEPASMFLLGSGLVGVAAAARRRMAGKK